MSIADLPGSAHLERLRRGKDHIDSAFAERISVADVAAVAGLSPGYFSREFRRVFGAPPHQYLMARRMERAAALLRDGDRPVAEVCRAVGLRSLGSFTTAFTRAFGLSPAAYRRRPQGRVSDRGTPRSPGPSRPG